MKRSTPVLVCLALCGLARADVAYDNFGPNTSYTTNGWIVYGPQNALWWSHAFPITPTVSGDITTITVAIVHLQGSPNNYTFELRADNSGSPGASLGILGQTAAMPGYSPPPVQFTSAPGIHITAGTPYWIFARGDTGNSQATWVTSPTNGGYRAYSFDGGANFTVSALGNTNAQGAIRIEVSGTTPPPCYANCDASTVPPVLNVQDFSCFLNKFANNETYANCDGSTVAPVLNVQDFSCFLNAFAVGCT